MASQECPLKSRGTKIIKDRNDVWAEMLGGDKIIRLFIWGRVFEITQMVRSRCHPIVGTGATGWIIDLKMPKQNNNRDDVIVVTFNSSLYACKPEQIE